MSTNQTLEAPVASEQQSAPSVARKDVHVYATVRFKVAGVSGTDLECMKKAEQALDISAIIDRTISTEAHLEADERRLVYIANAEETTGFLVDHVDANGDLICDVPYKGDYRPVHPSPPGTRLLSVGDYVEVTNDQGVYLGLKRVVQTNVDLFGPMYYLWPTGAHWMHWRDSNVRHVLGRTPSNTPAPDLQVSLDFGATGIVPVEPAKHAVPPPMLASERVTADVWADYTSDFHTYSSEPRSDLMLVRLRTSGTVIGMVRYLPDRTKRYVIRRGAHARYPADLRHYGPVRR